MSNASDMHASLRIGFSFKATTTLTSYFLIFSINNLSKTISTILSARYNTL
jgi:hypothetical protein